MFGNRNTFRRPFAFFPGPYWPVFSFFFLPFPKAIFVCEREKEKLATLPQRIIQLWATRENKIWCLFIFQFRLCARPRGSRCTAWPRWRRRTSRVGWRPTRPRSHSGEFKSSSQIEVIGCGLWLSNLYIILRLPFCAAEYFFLITCLTAI